MPYKAMILRGTSPYIYLTWTWHMIPSSWGPFLLTLFLSACWPRPEGYVNDLMFLREIGSSATQPGHPREGKCWNMSEIPCDMKYISDWNCGNVKAICFWKISSLAWRAMRQFEIHFDSSTCTSWHRCLALFSGSISSFQGATRFVWICFNYPD